MTVCCVFACVATTFAQPSLQSPGFFTTNVAISAQPDPQVNPPGKTDVFQHQQPEKHSGFYGQSFLHDPESSNTYLNHLPADLPTQCDLILYNERGEIVNRLSSNPCWSILCFCSTRSLYACCRAIKDRLVGNKLNNFV
jgi:hypothetical protein